MSCPQHLKLSQGDLSRTNGDLSSTSAIHISYLRLLCLIYLAKKVRSLNFNWRKTDSLEIICIFCRNNNEEKWPISSLSDFIQNRRRDAKSAKQIFWRSRFFFYKRINSIFFQNIWAEELVEKIIRAKVLSTETMFRLRRRKHDTCQANRYSWTLLPMKWQAVRNLDSTHREED